MRSRWKWSAEDLLTLEELTARGWSDARIGKALGCSAVAVQVVRKRNGIPCRCRAILSARAVASKVGVRCSKTVSWWIRAGYLKGRPGQRIGLYRMWYIREEALLDFLQDERYWHLWDPASVEAGLRPWVADIRNGRRYLTTGEVADRFHVTHKAVWQWIDRGLLPAVRHANWLVRESDLVGFIPPCERSKKGQVLRRFTPVEDAQLVNLRGAGATWEAIGCVLGRNSSSIAGRFDRLQRKRAEAKAAS